MGEGDGGGGQGDDLLGPPPLHPLPRRGGEILGRLCLINYGPLSNYLLKSRFLNLDQQCNILNGNQYGYEEEVTE